MSREIRISKGRTTIVDDEDFEYVNQWKWMYLRGSAARSKWIAGPDGKVNKHTTIYLHRLILGRIKQPFDGAFCDHIDGDRLNNTRKNLRWATPKENTRNAKVRSDNKSGHTGVYWREKSKDYVAHITFNGKSYSLKTHKTIQSAIAARNEAEKRLFGEFASERRVGKLV